MQSSDDVVPYPGSLLAHLHAFGPSFSHPLLTSCCDHLERTPWAYGSYVR